MEWDYKIIDKNGHTAATISKEIFNWTDTYVIDVVNPEDALDALLFVLAIDAENVPEINDINDAWCQHRTTCGI